MENISDRCRSSRAAQVAPLDAVAEFFGAHLAGGDALDGRHVLGRHRLAAEHPLVYLGRRALAGTDASGAQLTRQLGLGANSLDCAKDGGFVHARDYSQAITQSSSQAIREKGYHRYIRTNGRRDPATAPAGGKLSHACTAHRIEGARRHAY